MKTAYEKMQERQRKEFEELPIAYAFNDQQLKEALEKLGANDISECCTVFGHGDVVKKVDASKVKAATIRHFEELSDAMKDKKFAYEAFLYEMDNHDYAINWDGDADVLSCFGMNEKDLEKYDLVEVYVRARNAHFKHAREWDMI